MRQFLFSNGSPYTVDYMLPFVPASVRKLKPVILVDTSTKISYCCIYNGENNRQICGWGATPIEAMQNWDENYLQKKRKENTCSKMQGLCRV